MKPDFNPSNLERSWFYNVALFGSAGFQLVLTTYLYMKAGLYLDLKLGTAFLQILLGFFGLFQGFYFFNKILNQTKK